VPIAADGKGEFAREGEGAQVLFIDFEVVDGEVPLSVSFDALVGDAVFDFDTIDGDEGEAFHTFGRHCCCDLILDNFLTFQLFFVKAELRFIGRCSGVGMFQGYYAIPSGTSSCLMQPQRTDRPGSGSRPYIMLAVAWAWC
jgi:hypothetical protein